MTGVSFDVSELVKLQGDLDRAAAKLAPEARKVVTKGAVNIKQDWQSRWRGLSNLPALADAITYDTKFGVGTLEAEIGPDKGRRQGPLGNVVEFGTMNNAPRPGGGPALKAEAPRFEKAIGDMIEGLIS